MLDKIITRIQNVFSKGKITAIDETNRIQIQQNELHKGQTRSDIFAPQQYGLQSYPHINADTVCLFKGGSMENGYVMMSFDPRYKPVDIQEGDLYLYTAKGVEEQSKAVGTVEFLGTIEGTPIPVGTTVTNPENQQQYISTIEAKIINGKAWVRFEAVVGGLDGNAKQDTIVNLDGGGIPGITLTKINNMCIHRQKIWIKQEEGRILIETDGDDVQIIANKADINTSGDTTITAGANLNADVAGNANISVLGTTNFTCPQTNWLGNITVTGNINQTGLYNLTGTATATVDFISNGKSGATHQHTGNLGSPTTPPI